MNRVSEGEPRPGLVLSAAILASGTGFLMNSAMNIAVPTIQSYFEAGIGEIQWILNAYTLVLGSLILASGGLIDRFGLKRVYLSGMYLFLAGSLLCAVAWSTNALIGFRTVQGAGAALMVPGSLAAIKRVYPADGQGKAIGLWAGISGAIAGFGPFLGGLPDRALLAPSLYQYAAPGSRGYRIDRAGPAASGDKCRWNARTRLSRLSPERRRPRAPDLRFDPFLRRRRADSSACLRWLRAPFCFFFLC